VTAERDYSTFTPEELNGEMVLLCDQLPKITIFQYPDESVDIFDRREASGHKERLLGIFDRLLSFSPTTEAFRRHIRYVFSCVYSAGFDRSLPKPQIRFLDRNGPGIFGLPRREEIDAEEFKFVCRVQRDWDEGDMFDPSNTPRVLGTVSLNDEVEEWKKQFTELYGEEP